MSLRKRLRVLYAALTQEWVTFTCQCGTEVWVSDTAGKLLDGMLCDACEMKAYDKWVDEQEGERFYKALNEWAAKHKGEVA